MYPVSVHLHHATKRQAQGQISASSGCRFPDLGHRAYFQRS